MACPYDAILHNRSLRQVLRQIGASEAVDEVLHVLAIGAEHPTRARAGGVQAEGCDAGHDLRLAVPGSQEVGPSRVAKAGPSAMGVVRKQQGEVAREARHVDLDQPRLGVVARPASFRQEGSCGREALLQAVADRGEGCVTPYAQAVKLVDSWQRSVLGRVENKARLLQDHDADIVKVERSRLVEWVGSPPPRLDTVRGGERGVGGGAG